MADNEFFFLVNVTGKCDMPSILLLRRSRDNEHQISTTSVNSTMHPYTSFFHPSCHPSSVFHSDSVVASYTLAFASDFTLGASTSFFENLPQPRQGSLHFHQEKKCRSFFLSENLDIYDILNKCWPSQGT